MKMSEQKQRVVRRDSWKIQHLHPQNSLTPAAARHIFQMKLVPFFRSHACSHAPTWKFALSGLQAGAGGVEEIRLSQPDAITPSRVVNAENPPLSTGGTPSMHRTYSFEPAEKDTLLAPQALLNAMRADFAFFSLPAAYYKKKQRVSEWKRRTLYPLTCVANKSYRSLLHRPSWNRERRTSCEMKQERHFL